MNIQHMCGVVMHSRVCALMRRAVKEAESHRLHPQAATSTGSSTT
jgi:hypothetical protein